MKPRLGVLCWGLIGGSTVTALRGARLLASRGFEVHLAALPTRRGVPPVDGPEPLVGPPTQAVAAWARALDLDLVHVHHGWPLGPIAAEALYPKVPFALTLHGSEVTEDQPFASAARACSALFAPSRDLAAKAQHALRRERTPNDGCRWPEIAILPSPLDPAWFEPVPERELEPRRLRVAHLSTGRSVKRTDLALEVCARASRHLDRSGIRLELEVIGPVASGPLERAATELGLSGRLQVRGPAQPGRAWTVGACPELGSKLTPGWPAGSASFDALLITSRYESFCLAAQEALARGIEPLGPAVGGLCEAFGQHALGTWVDPAESGLAERLAAALTNFAEERRRDPSRHAERARRSREQVSELYGWKTLGPLWETAMLRALGDWKGEEGPPPGPHDHLFGPQRNLSAARGGS